MRIAAPLHGIIQCLLHPAFPCQVSSPGILTAFHRETGVQHILREPLVDGLQRDFDPPGVNSSKNSDSKRFTKRGLNYRFQK